MKKIVIYSSSLCSYCIAAKKLLEQQNLSFEEKNIDFDKQLKNEMIKKSSGKKTVPQIFLIIIILVVVMNYLKFIIMEI